MTRAFTDSRCSRRRVRRQVRAAGLHDAERRRRQRERRRDDDDQRQAGRGVTAGNRHGHQPGADHRPRIGQRLGQLGSAEAGRTAVQPQPHRPGALIPGLYATSYDVGGSNVRHRLRPRGPHLRPHRRQRRQLRRHDLGPDLRRLRHLRRGADHDRREGRRRDEPRRHDEPRRQVGQQHASSGLGSANYQSGDFQSTNVTDELLGRGYAPGVNKFTSLQGLLRRGRRADPARSPVVLREPPRRLVRQLHSRASSACPTASRWSSTRSCRIRPARSPTR